ncbi:hypothetical protein PLESTM_000532700 [Pleodorina starrii]|nr:hypothetical protein PLESTM_000532700 [Pleodorina starrii]
MFLAPSSEVDLGLTRRAPQTLATLDPRPPYEPPGAAGPTGAQRNPSASGGRAGGGGGRYGTPRAGLGPAGQPPPPPLLHAEASPSAALTAVSGAGAASSTGGFAPEGAGGGGPGVYGARATPGRGSAAGPRGSAGGRSAGAGSGQAAAAAAAPDAAAAGVAVAVAAAAAAAATHGPRLERGGAAAAAAAATLPMAGAAAAFPGQLLLQHQTPLNHHNHPRHHSLQSQPPPQPHPAVPQPQPVSVEALPLVDSSWAFDAAAAARALSDSGGDFRVIGLLGTQGAGKSALINALLYDTPPPPPGSAAAAAAATVASIAASSPRLQSGQQAEGLFHGTSRLELRVHPGDRTLLMDSPPLWSASWVSELASNSEPPLLHGAACTTTGSGATIMSRAIADARCCGLSSPPPPLPSPQLSVEGVAELLGLQMGALMLAACHVVVLMVDAVDEPRLWEYLQVIDMAAHCLPDVATAAAAAAAGAGAGAAAAAGGGAAGGGGGGGGIAAGTVFGAQGGNGSPRRVAELVVVLTGLYDDQLTVRHLRPQAEVLRMALWTTRLLSAPAGGGAGGGCGGSGAAEHRVINVLKFLGDDEDDGNAESYGTLLQLPTARGVNDGNAAGSAAAGDADVCSDSRLAVAVAVAGEGEGEGAEEGEASGGGDGGPTGRSREADAATGHRRRRQQQQQRQHCKPEDSGCGGSGVRDGSSGGGGGGGLLHFWALPRSWQHHHQQAMSSTTYDTRPPPPALLAPLRAALLGMSRRPLALALGSPSLAALTAAAAVTGGGGGPVPYTAPQPHPSPSQHHPPVSLSLSEREWLRGVERLWDIELQRCPSLESYHLARQRTAFAGGGGWSVGGR